MLKISADYFVPLALQRLAAGTDDEIKETVELLLLYRQIYSVPLKIRLAISAHLAPLLKHSDITIRYWSARALGEYHCPEVLPLLREALVLERNSSVRGWMQGAIAHISNVPIEHLYRDLQSSYPETRSMAAQALFFSSAPQAREMIASSMQEDDRSVLSWKLLALPGPIHMRSRAALIYPASSPAFWGDLSPTARSSFDLLGSLLLSGDDQVVEYSIWNASLDREGDLAPIIRRIAAPGGHTNPRVREWAYKFLGFVPDRGDLPLLRTALDLESDPKARQGIAFAMGSIGGPEALEYLVDMLHGDADDDVRRWAARAMLSSRVPWVDAEAKLIDAVERSDRKIVIREVLGVLELRSSAALLKNLPLIEYRARDQGTALTSLLLSVASERMDLAVKDRLLHILSDGRVTPPEITAVAYAMAEDYGVATRLVSVAPAWSTELDMYRQGFGLLLEAAMLSESDLELFKATLHNSISIMGALRHQLTNGLEDSASGLRLNPLVAFSQFYEELGLSHRDILGGIEGRLQGDLSRSIASLEEAAHFYKLHESDLALSTTERNLCSSIKLWLSFQLELTKFSLGEAFDKHRWSLALMSIETAILRAKDALRLSLARKLDVLLLEASEIAILGTRERIFERTAKVNQPMLSIPVALDAPFSATSAVVVQINEATVSRGILRLVCKLFLDRSHLWHRHEHFDVGISFHLSGTLVQRKILSSAEVSDSATSQVVLGRTLMLEIEGDVEPADHIMVQPLLHFPDLEIVCGRPMLVEVMRVKGQDQMQSSTELRSELLQKLDQEELRTVCQDLDIDYDDLRGEGRAGKARELVALLKRTNRLQDLQAILSRR